MNQVTHRSLLSNTLEPTTGEDRPPQKAKLHMRTKQTRRFTQDERDQTRITVDYINANTKDVQEWLGCRRPHSALGFWPQFAVSRFGCRLAVLISFCLRLKSIQTFRPSSDRRYPTVSAKSSFGFRPAGKCKPPLRHFPPPSHPSLSIFFFFFSNCCVNLIITTMGNFHVCTRNEVWHGP